MEHAPLAARWRASANALRRYAPEVANAWDDAAKELEEHDRERELEALTLTEASAESGYSEGHLGRLVSNYTLPNAGTKGAPRIRRCDLPRKPGGSRGQVRGEPDLAGEVLRARGFAGES